MILWPLNSLSLSQPVQLQQALYDEMGKVVVSAPSSTPSTPDSDDASLAKRTFARAFIKARNEFPEQFPDNRTIKENKGRR